MNRRRNNNKPWPTEARDVYTNLIELADTLDFVLYEMHSTGMGQRDFSVIRESLPIVKRAAMIIQNECDRYRTLKTRRTPYWCGRAVDSIDDFANEIVAAMSEAERAFTARPPRLSTVAAMIERALLLPALIVRQLYRGPAPQEDKIPDVWRDGLGDIFND